jgi:Fe-Mn family superoxide dismutase
MEAPYKPRHFDLGGLQGISDGTLETHFRLYEDYVAAANTLSARLAEMANRGKDDGDHAASLTLLERRLGFEYHGMVLHEHYFGNLKRAGPGEAARNSGFRAVCEACFDGHVTWRREFAALGRTRGPGWAIACIEPDNGRLSNHWITLNEVGHLSSFVPVLVMDAWDHAFVPDFGRAQRASYVETFFANVDWTVVEARVSSAIERRTSETASAFSRRPLELQSIRGVES